jgi:hypothetical protein
MEIGKTKPPKKIKIQRPIPLETPQKPVKVPETPKPPVKTPAKVPV